MNRPEIQRGVVFNNNVYIIGDIVRIYHHDFIGNYVYDTGRIYKIDDLYVYIDTSRPYESKTSSFRMCDIENMERVLTENDSNS